jgi:amino acid adenylation domain-containing protein
MLMDGLLHQARLRPNDTAVSQMGRTLDYSQLVGRAFAFARMLRSRGVGSGDRVALVAPKSIEALVATVGASLAGSVFIPCDPRIPPERLVRVLCDCDPKVVVSTSATIDRIHQVDSGFLASLAHVCVIGACSLPNAMEYEFASTRDSFEIDAVPDEQAAYILYTSGTTGDPKGVVHSHLSALSFVSWAIATFHLQGDSVIANHAQWSFDLSVLDLWASLSSGARIELVPPEFALRPKEFVRRLEDWGVTHFYSVPSMIGLLESDGSLRERQLPHLKQLLYAGEPFAIPRLRAVMECLPQALIYNLFGPTETNVCLFYKIPSLPEHDAHHVPIGKACEHLTVELLDENGHATPASEEGEICVAGPSVLTEYFRLPVETAGSFFTADQFLDARRRYRTGDRASIDNHGLFWFHGRRDRLVKRRGFRIELGEIEAVVNAEPNVMEACAYAVRVGDEIRIHVATVLRPGGSATPLSLKIHCGRSLPPYMVPDAIALLDELPRTANGKVDLPRLGSSSTL